MLTGISVSAAVGLSLFVIYLFRLVVKQKQNLDRFQGVTDIEAEKEKIESEITELYRQKDTIRKEKISVEGKLASLNRQLSMVEDEVNIQSYGLYQPKYDLGFSAKLKEQLTEIRKKQKTMIREKTAIVCYKDWTVDGSRTKGKQMIDRQIRLMARAFNGECDSIISKVKYNNVMRIVKRIEIAYDAINKLGEPQVCRIHESYFNLKIDELHVVHRYQEQLQFEKEEKRRINEHIREEQRAQREAEKAQREAEKEEKRYQKALEEARQAVEEATGKKHEKLLLDIQRLNELLLEAQANKERALSRA